MRHTARKLRPWRTGLAAFALLGIGFGAVHWAKVLMSDHEKVDERHPIASDPETRTARVVGGTSWGAVIAATAEHGLTASQDAHGLVRPDRWGTVLGAAGSLALAVVLRGLRRR